MKPENEFAVDDLMAEAGALWLDGVAAFDGVRAAFTTLDTFRQGVFSSFPGPVVEPRGGVAEGYIARLCAALAFPYGRLATCRQVHGANVARVECAERRWYDTADGLATRCADLPLAVFTADCVPVAVWAPGSKALAVVHAGWRGSLAKITAAAVERLAAWWGGDPAAFAVFLGPAAGACCYDVGAEVVEAAARAFGPKSSLVISSHQGRSRLDLHRANELAAQEAGVLPANIYRVATCTICDRRFDSWRRLGEDAGRMMAIASVSTL